MLLTELKTFRAKEYRELTGAKHDQYYLLPQVFTMFAQWIKSVIKHHNLSVTRIEDPCAGDGHVCTLFPTIDMFDLDPKSPKVSQRDFLLHTQEHERGLLLIMNVPYGVNSRGAISFFNHGASFADYLAIIVPATWSKQGFISRTRLNKNFHNIETFTLPKNSFFLPDSKNKKPYDVPSVAMFWVRKDIQRDDSDVRITHSPLVDCYRNTRRVISTVHPDIAIRRTGASAGEIATDNFDSLTQDGWWFIVIKKDRYNVLKAIHSIDWLQYGNKMGQRGINKTELISAIEQYVQK